MTISARLLLSRWGRPSCQAASEARAFACPPVAGFDLPDDISVVPNKSIPMVFISPIRAVAN